MKQGLMMQFSRRSFFRSRISHMNFAPRPTTCIQRTTTCANANYQSCFLSHGESGARRAKTQPFYHCTDIWPQLRTRCAGEEAVPSTCVGGARPCAGRGAARARSAVPQRPRQVRANLLVRPCTCGRRGATAPRRSRRDGGTTRCAGRVCKRTY
jgi:hypothetical protein